MKLIRVTTFFALAFATVLLRFSPVRAASPAADTVSRPGNLTVTWKEGPLIGSTTSPLAANCSNSPCDTFYLTVGSVNPGDEVTVSVKWTNPANDFDLYIFDSTGAQVGSSGDSAPDSVEETTIPAVPGRYSVRVLVYSVAVDSIAGTATLHAGAAPRIPTYLAGNFTFSPNRTVKAPVPEKPLLIYSVSEPSVRVDQQGNVYTGGPRGIGQGDDVWKTNVNSDPCLSNWNYLGAPDAFTGGGDIEISVGFPTDNSLPQLVVTGLSGANITSCNSMDSGATFTCNPAAATVAGDDRQWNEFHGSDTVYLFYRAPGLLTGLFVQKSTDAGQSFAPASFIAIGSTPGYLAVDQNDGTVYLIHGSSSQLFVSRSKNATQWSTTIVANTNPRNLFPVVKVDKAGNVYAVWSDGRDIFLSTSTNQGLNWTPPVQVNDPADPNLNINIMPWMEAGDSGRVNIVWYGTDEVGPSSEVTHYADWHVYFAQTLNPLDANITFFVVCVCDHIFHHGSICLSGTGCEDIGSNRDLLDYFQIATDPQGAAVVSWADDHNDFIAQVFVARQTSGTTVLAASPNLPPQNCPPPPVHTDPEVVDFAGDVQVDTGTTVPASALDILDIDYDEEVTGGQLYLKATMKLADLSGGLPENLGVRMYLAFSPNIADNGNQYYMEMDNVGGITTYHYGTALRDTAGGSPLDTQVGDADSGSVTLATPGIVTVYIAANKLTNPVTGLAPAGGDRVLGLRGRSFVHSGAGTRITFDRTRGGSELVLCGALQKGDMNSDGIYRPGDVVSLLRCVFLGTGNCTLCLADVNCDIALTPADVVVELNRVFLGISDPPWCGM